MPSKLCTVCGNDVAIPKRIDKKNTKRDKDGRPIVKCGFCGATALLWKRRNGNVKGLKGCFVNPTIKF